MYAEFSAAEWQRLQALLVTEKYREAQPMTLTYYERGQLEERLEATLLQLETRFGVLTAAAKQRVEAKSPQELRQLQMALVRAQTLQELGLEA